ncbi:MAG: ATP phosphoribosyltransferase regulatory subunit [Clostridium sp.]|jgi:ATP phosphoribosyltransferase regulatory subunit|nr:ATP phosphoribosyltransferase regulatory subunit [Clostridium sp.]
MKQYAVCTPEGTRDLLFNECRALRRAEALLCELLSSRGYQEVVTPTLEFFDVFRPDGGVRPLESLYSLFDPQGRVLVMRPDSTLPIARIAATRLKDAFYPLRLYYRQSVFRRSARYAGELDETMQGGLELIGADGNAADMEVLLLSLELLEKCGGQYSLELGHAGFFNALAEYFGIGEQMRESIHLLLAAKDFAALGDLLDGAEQPEAREAISALPELFGGEEVLDRAERLVPTAKARQALEQLRMVLGLLKDAGYEGKISLDLSPNSWGSYYTGLVFRGYLAGCGHVVLSGGRYNKLLREYGKDLPAIGMGVELGALSKLLEQPKAPAPDVLVFASPGREVEALARVRELAESGKTAELALNNSLAEAECYAAARGISSIEQI